MAATVANGEFPIIVHDEHDATHTHSHAQDVIFFLFAALAMGALTMHVLTRFIPSLPYTCVLLVEGIFMGIVHEMRWWSAGSYGYGLELWAGMDPHLLLFIFLPALLWGDAQYLNWHMVKKCLGQCLVLACPGVIIGACVTGLAVMYIFPYGWSFYQCMMFGSMLSATDPVAVVSILKEVGASPKLTMIVSGESLLNDGTAIVLFNLFMTLATHEREGLDNLGVPSDRNWVEMEDVLKYFVRMVFVGVAFGVVCGVVAVVWLALAQRKTNHSDTVIQISVSICCAYLSYFIAEHTLHTSGVLAVVTAALVVAAFGWPYYVSRETNEHVWHMIEWIGNTLIFILSGVILGATSVKSMSSDLLQLNDFGLLLLLWLILQVARLIMVILCYPVLRRCGYGFTKPEAAVLAWGGLRGAVGMALAVEVVLHCLHDRESRRFGAQVLFHAGGIAAMTLLVNGLLSAPLLKYLGMGQQEDEVEEAVFEDIHRRIQERCMKAVQDQLRNLGEGWTEAQQQELTRRCGILQRRPSEHLQAVSTIILSRVNNGGPPKVVAIRGLFFNMLQSEYLEQTEQGLLLRNGTQQIILKESVDVARERVDQGLFDFAMVRKQCEKAAWAKNLLSWVDNRVPAWIPLGDCLENAGITVRPDTVCHTVNCFIHAHMSTQLNLTRLLRKDSMSMGSFGSARPEGPNNSILSSLPSGAAVEMVLGESDEEVRQARLFLKEMSPHVVENARVTQVANVVLAHERQLVEELLTDGALQDAQAHHLIEQIEKDIQGARLESKRRRGGVALPRGSFRRSTSVASSRNAMSRPMSRQTSPFNADTELALARRTSGAPHPVPELDSLSPSTSGGVSE